MAAGAGTRRRWLRWAGAALGLVARWVLVAGRMLVAAGDARDAGGAGEVDAVVVLSGGRRGQRVVAGVEAFRASGAPRLVFVVEARGPVYDPRDDLLA